MQDYQQLATAVPNAGVLGLRNIVETLFRRRKLFATLVFLFVFGMAAYIVSRPTVYQAEMTFLVKNDRADLVGSPGQTGNLATRQRVDEIQVNTEVQLLSSRELLREVARKCWFSSPGARTASDAELDRAAQRLERSVSVTPLLKANMIRVSSASGNLQETVTVLRALADLYLDRHLNLHSTTGSYEFFHLHALYYGQRLKQAQDELVRFQGSRNKFQPMDRSGRQVEEQITHSHAALAGERAGTTTEEASELNPPRQSLDAELSKVRTTVSGLEGRVRTVTQQIRDYHRQLADMDRAAGANDQLLRNIKECEENYFLYSRKGEEARIAEALDRQKISNVELIDAPRLPSAAQPKFNRPTAAAGLLGLLLIVCAVFAASVLRNTVSTSAELEALLGLPVLATVPFQKGLAIEPWAPGSRS